jgi:hypothetical protein
MLFTLGEMVEGAGVKQGYELVLHGWSECLSKPHDKVQGNVKLFHAISLVNFTPSNSAHSVFIYFLFSDT